MHAGRNVHYVDKEGPIPETDFLSFAHGHGCPMAGAAAPSAEEPKYPRVKFGRLFPPRWGKGKSRDELMKIAHSLMSLGRCMDDPETCHRGPAGVAQEVSDIPAGYTYLGQFITHEITFDATDGLPLVELKPENVRSPSLDLDSLYGIGLDDEEKKRLDDQKVKRLYEEKNPARLKVGWTQPPPNAFPGKPPSFDATFDSDLPRVEKEDKEGVVIFGGARVAMIGDERNDENLPLAQTHVAFIKFHNRVVDDLAGGRYRGLAAPPDDKLFETAREEVVKHFQWIVLKDYLPRIVGDDVVNSVLKKPELYPPSSRKKLFIPLEFSAAAFRIGHSMVRRKYEWNRRQRGVQLSQLFTHTKRSGNLDGFSALDSTWVIDWKRFYDFTPFPADYPRPYDLPRQPNLAGRLDTVFDLHLGRIKGFDHGGLPKEKRAITVRNLRRGLALGLPWGEDVAAQMEKKRLLKPEERLTPAELRKDVPHPELLNAEEFEGKTPLWFYILKEARERGKGCKLGRVGGRIVAETLVALIRHSYYSILRRKQTDGAEMEWTLSDWRPAYGRSAAPETFEMVDLLRAADVVDLLGKRVYEAEHSQLRRGGLNSRPTRP